MNETKTILVAVSDIFFYTKIRDAFLPSGGFEPADWGATLLIPLSLNLFASLQGQVLNF